jgi:hypothetical protein
MVLRFSNTDVLKNIDGVIGAIVQAFEKSSDGTDRNKSKTPWPPFQGGSSFGRQEKKR